MPVRTAIKVISLETSSERRQAFTQMASDTKLDWSFFPACTGIVAPLTYDARRASRRSGRPMTPSEVGCYASHFKLWEWLVNSEYDQIIVFEDDVIVNWPLIAQVAATRFGDYGVDFLRFFATHPFKWKLIKHRLFSAHTNLTRLAGVTYGCQGYLITKTAARVFVSKYSEVAAPIDWMTNWYWEHRVINYFLFPAPIMEQFAPSTIGGERHQVAAPSFFDRLVHFGWMKWDKIKRAYVELFIIKKYPLGPAIGINDVFIKPESTSRDGRPL